jgi:hypothetical protein
MASIVARCVWKLARRHTWGSPIPREQLVRLVANDDDHDTVSSTIEQEVTQLPFVERATDGIYIPNSRAAHIGAADWLRSNTTIRDLQIAATLSRLPDDWP